MRFHVEYKDGKGLDQIIHLLSKNNFEALNEMQAIARHLTENRIDEWHLVSTRDKECV